MRVINFQKLNKPGLPEANPLNQGTAPAVPVLANQQHEDSLGHQEEDWHLTNFLTPWGMFNYCNLP